MTRTDDRLAALGPVVEHMRRTARDQAARIQADARREAAGITQEARRQAAAAVSSARAEGRAEAAPLVAAELSRAGATARSAVLRAQREAGDELRRRVRAAVAAMPGEPGYDRLAERLARLAGRAAGPDATVTALPSGGVLARSPGVVVDCSLARLADLAVDALGPSVRGLWTP